MGHLAGRPDGGLFQLIWEVFVHSVLGDLGCGFCQYPGPPCLAAHCGFLFHGQMEPWEVLENYFGGILDPFMV